MTAKLESQADTFSSASQLGRRPRLLGEKKAARATLMKWVLAGYFAVLLLSVVIPFLAALWLTNGQLASFKEVLQQTSGLSQGLFGILGVVVGYYFKEARSAESD